MKINNITILKSEAAIQHQIQEGRFVKRKVRGTLYGSEKLYEKFVNNLEDARQRALKRPVRDMRRVV